MPKFTRAVGIGDWEHCGRIADRYCLSTAHHDRENRRNYTRGYTSVATFQHRLFMVRVVWDYVELSLRWNSLCLVNVWINECTLGLIENLQVFNWAITRIIRGKFKFCTRWSEVIQGYLLNCSGWSWRIDLLSAHEAVVSHNIDVAANCYDNLAGWSFSAFLTVAICSYIETMRPLLIYLKVNFKRSSAVYADIVLHSTAKWH